MNEMSAGFRDLGSGFTSIVRSPRMLLLGGVPALLSSLLLLTCVVVLALHSGDVASWLTPFADEWSWWWRRSLRLLLAITLVAGAVLLGSVSFIALTLLIGGPFYDHIAERTERERGLADDGDGAGGVRLLWRGLADALRLVCVGVVGAVVLFALGFVPLLGQTVVPVVGLLFGGWLIALELTGPVFQRRGTTVGGRHRILWRHRRTVLGFAVPTYLLCLIPVAQLVVVPAAVVGGTLLGHRVLGSRWPEERTPAESLTSGKTPGPG
ncbi:CysZ protein [Actinopolyspora xinjiangensis]|uniref:CysZ protein n=1 Tax=Actinopolyspora xinjiangensis TaxID=405564 RepID=A0A1H0SL49_9ACTN|nr:EI24 domain-containing protein [Actinopolyspora xinjiangensis]SDP42395.1 CysZ protein [Actinopolyspora xinjiangensis]